MLPVLALRWIDPSTSAFMLLRQWEQPSHAYRIDHVWREWHAISPHLALAVLAAEDQRFPQHRGFDITAIQSALAEHRDGKNLRGASTLSQQTAKNLYLWPGRSYLRKGLEAWFTVCLELLVSKRRILEIYLNVAEFGDGIYGAEAAAQHYFNKSADRLTLHEAALLAALLPNPRAYRIDPPTEYMQTRATWIEQQVRQLGGTAFLETL